MAGLIFFWQQRRGGAPRRTPSVPDQPWYNNPLWVAVFGAQQTGIMHDELSKKDVHR